MQRWLYLVVGAAVGAAVVHCGRKRTALLEHNCDELLQLTPARLSRIQPQTFQMLWPSTTTNYGGRGMQIASL